MEKFNYQIGSLEIDYDRLQCSLPERPAHKFVVGALENNLSIWVAHEKRHVQVVSRFMSEGPMNRATQIVGGGDFYLDLYDDFLMLSGWSGDYGAVRADVAEVLGSLVESDILDELARMSIPCEGVMVCPCEAALREYWKRSEIQGMV